MSDTNDQQDLINELAEELLENPPNGSRQYEIEVSENKPLSQDNQIEKFVNDSIQQTDSILQQVLLQYARDVGDDPERIAALSQLVKSKSDSIKILADQLNKARDNETKIELQKLKQQGETIREIINGEDGKSVVSTRDEIFKEVLKEAEVVQFDEDEE